MADANLTINLIKVFFRFCVVLIKYLVFRNEVGVFAQQRKANRGSRSGRTINYKFVFWLLCETSDHK